MVRFLEKLGEYFFAGGTLSGIPEYVSTHFTWHRFAAAQIWIFVLFLIYTSIAQYTESRCDSFQYQSSAAGALPGGIADSN